MVHDHIPAVQDAAGRRPEPGRSRRERSGQTAADAEPGRAWVRRDQGGEHQCRRADARPARLYLPRATPDQARTALVRRRTHPRQQCVLRQSRSHRLVLAASEPPPWRRTAAPATAPRRSAGSRASCQQGIREGQREPSWDGKRGERAPRKPSAAVLGREARCERALGTLSSRLVTANVGFGGKKFHDDAHPQARLRLIPSAAVRSDATSRERSRLRLRTTSPTAAMASTLFMIGTATEQAPRLISSDVVA